MAAITRLSRPGDLVAIRPEDGAALAAAASAGRPVVAVAEEGPALIMRNLAVVMGWDTGIVVFVADDLGAWLISLLADAGRRKLTAVLFGPDQERALRSAATAAVRLTASELCEGDDQQAEQAALVISQVFSDPALCPLFPVGSRRFRTACWIRADPWGR